MAINLQKLAPLQGIFSAVVLVGGISLFACRNNSEAKNSIDNYVKIIEQLPAKDKRAVSIYMQGFEPIKPALQTKYLIEINTNLKESLVEHAKYPSSGPLNRDLRYRMTVLALKFGYDSDPGIIRAKQMLSDLDVQ